ncbi:alpha/beta fold hydrolase [Granulimonas faecalis]|uniref:alpha/beta fold hydrolase n=1 Tax=Granulimonas faecalis TaxID=2894155 RepID=UPI003519A620
MTDGPRTSVTHPRAQDHLAARGHRAVAYDVRGHGASDKPAAFSMADHVADLLGLCCALGLTRPALVGFSMGSYIALRTAELHPPRVRADRPHRPRHCRQGRGPVLRPPGRRGPRVPGHRLHDPGGAGRGRPRVLAAPRP